MTTLKGTADLNTLSLKGPVDVDTSALPELQALHYLNIAEKAEKALPSGHYKAFYNVHHDEYQFIPIVKTIKGEDL